MPPGSQPAAGGSLLVTATTAAFYTSDSASTFLSTATFAPYVALHDRIGFALRSNLWLPHNEWVILGDTRFLYYPQYTWGLGGNPNHNTRLLIDYKYYRFYQSILKRIGHYLFAGAGYHLDDHWDMDTKGDSNLLRTFTHYYYGTGSSEKSLSSGLTLDLLYDTRINSINPLPGSYANVVYRVNPVWLGSNTNWRSLYADIRKYIALSRPRQDLLAFWAYYWTVMDRGRTPYLDLPSIGWDPYQQRSGRGFPQNRYRGKGLVYFESEYRRDLTENGLLGFVLFGNLNSVTEPAGGRFTYIHPAGGGGLRIKFNRHSNTNIALDYGHSKDYSGVYLNLGETF